MPIKKAAKPIDEISEDAEESEGGMDDNEDEEGELGLDSSYDDEDDSADDEE